MNLNLNGWDYYPQNNKKFIDPLYLPYQNVLARSNNDGQMCPMNGFKLDAQGNDLMVNPALVRRGWGMDFQLMHPDNPCPTGWARNGGDGWCYQTQENFGKNGLYSEKAFVAKFQYFDAYGVNPLKVTRGINEFDNHSVNPYTGDFVVYNTPKPARNNTKYQVLPSKDSLLA